MKKLLGWVLALSIATLAWSATPAAKKVPAKKAKGSASAARKSKNSKTSKRSSVSWRNRQTMPTNERYKEIQEALVSKGYLQPGDATGSWGQASIDGLKRFQADQKIDTTGKINSLSLIALGLGPKHDAMAAAPMPEQASTR